MKENIKFFNESIFAGLAIGLGGLAKILVSNLCMNLPILAAMSFSIGIILVLTMKFKLYTGFTPTFTNYEKPIPKFFICLAGNFVGATFLGLAVKVFNLTAGITAENIVSAFVFNISVASLWEIFASAVVCGIIIACIVRIKNEPLKYIMSVPLIALFILAGCHHIVADFFYMALALSWNIPILIAVLLGNTLGGLIFGAYDLIKT